jgi:tetratricopeptide (TPR) repeat protein
MFKTIIIILFSALAAFSQDLELANTYFKQAEYEKAIELYKKLATNKDQARLIHSDYISALYKNKDLVGVEKFLKSQIKSNSSNYTYKAEYAQFLENVGKSQQANAEFLDLIKEAAANDNSVYELLNFFFKSNRLEMAADVLLASRDKMKDPHRHDTSLWRVYMYLDKKDKMLDEVLSYGFRNKNQGFVQSAVQDNITTEAEIEILEKKLYELIQNQPLEAFYIETLIWHFTQKQDFARAFIQARALDLRLNTGGSRVFELANQSFNSKDFKNAAKMFQFIIDQYPDAELAPYAQRWLIQSKEEIIKTSFPVDIAQITDLINQYQTLITNLGEGPKTLEAMRNKALLEAFYLGKHTDAVESLNKAITAAKTNQKFKDMCKLDMGDIYILKNEPWESTLLYMQVEKSQKEEPLGELAKLKNAKLQYYTGQFELSKEILDILKKATTREISNDALQLSLLIQDNTGLDSNEVAMADFANVDLLIFQNKYDESIKVLGQLYEKYKAHSLADEILWLRANMLLKTNQIPEAIKDLEKIVENYKYDILIDDALFTLAKVTQENLKDKTKAMALFKQILTEYPGSVFAAQARVKFRELRGDSL